MEKYKRMATALGLALVLSFAAACDKEKNGRGGDDESDDRGAVNGGGGGGNCSSGFEAALSAHKSLVGGLDEDSDPADLRQAAKSCRSFLNKYSGEDGCYSRTAKDTFRANQGEAECSQIEALAGM